MYLGELRIKLDQMSERIVSGLKDRSRFPQNPTVYRADGVEIEGRGGISFLDYAIEGLEEYHAKLGRFSYPDQFPVFTKRPHNFPVKREIPKDHISRIDISLGDQLIEFYRSILLELCNPGDDPTTYGETAYVDAVTLELIHERLNIGRYVAESKLEADSSILDIAHDSNLLAARLRDPAREQTVVDKAREMARRYELDPDITAKVFGWIIGQTLLLEGVYIQKTRLQHKIMR